MTDIGAGELSTNMMAKKAPNPTDKHVGSRVRMRRMMLSMSQEKPGDALGLTFQQVQKIREGHQSDRCEPAATNLAYPAGAGRVFLRRRPPPPGRPVGLEEAPSPAY